MESTLSFQILPQPDKTTCGPTCLHGVYSYFKDTISLEQVIGEVEQMDYGGVIAAQLGVHALDRGYKATLISYNLNVFDPTWFNLLPRYVIAKLKAQRKAKRDRKLAFASQRYIEFLEKGGRLRFTDLTPSLLRKYLRRELPIISGLSSTYLYQEARERREDGAEDDINGYPSGHFVVIFGYNAALRTVRIADPLKNNPVGDGHIYEVGLARLVCAILLGTVTYDANLLVIEPGKKKREA